MPMRRYIVTSMLGGVLQQLRQGARSSKSDMPARIASKDGVKATQFRVWKALLMLLVSMTGGAMLLMAIGNNPPSAGAFCLSSYYKLPSTDQAVTSHTVQAMGRWNRIEVCYSGTRGGNIEWLTYLRGLSHPNDLECHFVICNGFGGEDGQILTTQKWDSQQSIPSQGGYRAEQTIRIAVVADARFTYPTDCQIKRTEALVDTLCRRFAVNPESVFYPADMTTGQAR